MIGNYRIIRTLSESERATIYLASELNGDPGLMARQAFMEITDRNLVALKIYHPEVSSEKIAMEAEILEALRGPGVVQLRDLLNLPDGTRGLVMEALTGPSLADRWEEGSSFSPGEAVTILASLSATLGRIVKSGYVHGAVWAGNLRFDAAGRPVITGFGSARKHAEQSTDWLDFYALLRGCSILLDEKQTQLVQIGNEMKKRLDPLDPNLAAWVEASLFRLADPQPIKHIECAQPIQAEAEVTEQKKASLLEKHPWLEKVAVTFKRPPILFGGLFAAVLLVLLAVVPPPDEDGSASPVATVNPPPAAAAVSSAAGSTSEGGQLAAPSAAEAHAAPAPAASAAAAKFTRSQVAQKLRKVLQECLANHDNDCIEVMSELSSALEKEQ